MQIVAPLSFFCEAAIHAEVFSNFPPNPSSRRMSASFPSCADCACSLPIKITGKTLRPQLRPNPNRLAQLQPPHLLLHFACGTLLSVDEHVASYLSSRNWT